MKSDRGGIVVAADGNKRFPLNGRQRNAAPPMIVRFSFALVIVAACVRSCRSQVTDKCNYGVVRSKRELKSRSYIGGLFSAHRLGDPDEEPEQYEYEGSASASASGNEGPTTGDVGDFPVCATTFVANGIMINDRLHRYGVEQVEALLLAIDQIKEESSKSPWSSLDYLVYDSCGDIQSQPLDCVTNQAKELGVVPPSAFATVVGPYYRPPNAVTPSQMRIDGVYNAARGPDTEQYLSGVMSLLDEPHSLIDTSSGDPTYDLDRQVVFMEASCEIQARAAVDIINRLGWQEVQVVVSGDNCGHESFETFKRTITEMDLSCVIRPTYRIPPKTMKKRAASNIPKDVVELWESLKSSPTTAIVLLSSIAYAYDFLEEYVSLYDDALLNASYSFLVGDCWGSPRKAPDLYQLMLQVAERALSLVTLRTVTEGLDKFQNHMSSIRVNSSEIQRNSLLREYWEEYFDCSIADGTCDEDATLPPIDRPILRNYKAALVIDSVYLAVAYGESESTMFPFFDSTTGIFGNGEITNVTSWTGNRVQLGDFDVRPESSFYRVPVTWSYDVLTWSLPTDNNNSTSMPPSSNATKSNSTQTPTPSLSSNVTTTTNNGLGLTPTLASSSINATSPSTLAPTTQSASEPNATASNSNAPISTQAAPTLATSNLTNNSTPTLPSPITMAANESPQTPPPSLPSPPPPAPPKVLVRYGVWTYTIENRTMTSSLIPDPKFSSSIWTPVKRLSKHYFCPTTLPPTTPSQTPAPSRAPPPQLCAPSDILASITVPILLMIFHISLVGMSIFNLGFTDLRKKISLFPFILFVTLTFVSILLSLLISVDAFSAFECTSNIAVDFVINFFTVICVAVLFIEVLAHLANGMLNRVPVKIFLIGLIILIELIVSGVASFNVDSAPTESMGDDAKNGSRAANSSTPPPFNPADPEGCLDARSRPIVAFSYWFLIIFVVASVVVLWITHVKGYQSRLKRRSIVDLFIVSLLAVFYLASVCLVVWAPNCKMQAGFLVVLAAFPAMITLFIGSVMARRKYLEMKGLPIAIRGGQLKTSMYHHQYVDQQGRVIMTDFEPMDFWDEDITKEINTVVIFPERIVKEERIGKGNFGEVFRGTLDGKKVAIKSVQDAMNRKEVNDFVREGLQMREFKHPNVMELLGICWSEEKMSPYHRSPLIVLPYMELGDLKIYLRQCRPGRKSTYVNQKADKNPAPQRSVTLVQLVRFGQQVSKGMDYISGKGIVHRDLAARNCMVNWDLDVKVADFGLSRAMKEGKDYYRMGQGGQLPVRWMAPESLLDHVFTSKSDVWAYGITLWEVMTLAMVPYPGVSNSDVIPFLQTGQRLDKPSECPSEVYDIMRRCWADEPDDRPTFEEITMDLEEFLAELMNYFDPTASSGDGGDAGDPYRNWSLSTKGYSEDEEKKMEKEKGIVPVEEIEDAGDTAFKNDGFKSAEEGNDDEREI